MTRRLTAHHPVAGADTILRVVAWWAGGWRMDVEVGCRQCFESPDQVYSWRSKKEGIHETLSAAIAADKNLGAAFDRIHSHERIIRL